jgi:hypothetical protein
MGKAKKWYAGRFVNNQQKPTKTNKNQQKPTKTNKNQQKPTKTNKNQQKPTKTYFFIFQQNNINQYVYYILDKCPHPSILLFYSNKQRK